MVEMILINVLTFYKQTARGLASNLALFFRHLVTEVSFSTWDRLADVVRIC